MYKFKVYIYDHRDMNRSKRHSFEECTDIEDIFWNIIFNHCERVYNINDADFAYFPFRTCSVYLQRPSKAFQLTWIRKYNNLLAPPEIRKKIPHFITWCYVLYNIDLSCIPEDIYIISLEHLMTIFKSTNTSNIGCYNRMICVPYILSKQTHKSAIKTTSISSEYINNIDYVIGEFDSRKMFGYVGRLTDKYRNKILDYFKNIDITNILIDTPTSIDPFEIYKKTKYALILRGDTPTRKAFYHALAAGAIPILFESTVEFYEQIMIPINESINDNRNIINIRDIALIIPDPIDYTEDSITNDYLNKIENIILEEKSKYKVEQHYKIKEIFNKLDYFSLIDSIPIPVYNVLNYIKTKRVCNIE